MRTDMRQYFYSNKGIKQGPFTLEHLATWPTAKEIVPETLIWFQGVSDWTPASKLLEFHSMLGIAAPETGLTPPDQQDTPMEKYFYSNGDEDHGPFTLTDLKYGRHADAILNDTLIWVEGSLTRTRAAEVIELNKVSVNVSPNISQSSVMSNHPVKADEKVEFMPPPLPKELQEESDKPEMQSQSAPPPIPQEAANIFIISNLVTIYRQSFTLKGRTSRSEFWSFQLFYWLFLVVGFFFFGGVVLAAFIIVSIPAMFSIQVRRLHDADWSGWWLLLNLIPTLGSIFLLIVYCFGSTPGSNIYGAGQRPDKERVPPVFVSEFD